MAEEQKPLSEKLRALRDEFNDLATRSKAAASRLDVAIMEAKSAELRADLDKVLDQFIPTVDKSPLKGHDIVLLVNKSQDMGEGIFSPIGAALHVASSLNSATSGHDTKVSAILWEGNGSTKAVNLNDYDRIEKAYEKTNSNAKELLPAVKEIMVSNTPDKQGDRRKHYIVVSNGNVTDNIDFSAQMINTAMQMNPRVTFDFVNFGDGNIKDLVAKLAPANEDQKSAQIFVAKHEDLNAAVMGVLTSRFKGEVPASVDAPKVEPPKTEPVAETTTAQTEAVPAASSEKVEPPAAAVEAPAASAPQAEKKRWPRFRR